MLGGTVQMESCCRLNAHSAVAPQRLSRTGCTPNKVTSCYALQDRATSSRIQSEQPQQRCCQRLEAGGLQRWCDLNHGHQRSRLHSRGLSDRLFRKGCGRRRGDRSKVVGVDTPSPKAISTVDKAAETATDSQDKQTAGTSTTRDDIRNIAIIAHVDHGKTTLVDAMLRQAKVFRENQVVQERIMDSNALERERGITILSKNTAIRFKNVKINIIDTPGHSDFGGEVERVLNMVDGVLLLVDSVEGPMPQTRFVLKKAVELGHKVVVVVNKIDRPSARPGFVVDSTFELFCELNASDEQCDFPVVYASGVQGVAGLDPGQLAPDLEPLFDTIISKISPPIVLKDAPLQMLVTNLDYDEHKGRIAIGRVSAGILRIGDEVKVCTPDDQCRNAKVNELFVYDNFQRVPATVVEAGDICALSGLSDVQVFSPQWRTATGDARRELLATGDDEDEEDGDGQHATGASRSVEGGTAPLHTKGGKSDEDRPPSNIQNGGLDLRRSAVRRGRRFGCM